MRSASSCWVSPRSRRYRFSRWANSSSSMVSPPVILSCLYHTGKTFPPPPRRVRICSRGTGICFRKWKIRSPGRRGAHRMRPLQDVVNLRLTALCIADRLSCLYRSRDLVHHSFFPGSQIKGSNARNLGRGTYWGSGPLPAHQLVKVQLGAVELLRPRRSSGPPGGGSDQTRPPPGR